MKPEQLEALLTTLCDSTKLHVAREIAAAVSPLAVRLSRIEGDLVALESLIGELEARLGERDPAARLHAVK